MTGVFKFFVEVIRSTLKDTLVLSLSFGCLFIFSIISISIVFLSVIFWPFYPYNQVSSFVDGFQNDYVIEMKIPSKYGEEYRFDNVDDFSLMAGRFYCGTKLIHQQDKLLNFLVNTANKDEDFEAARIYKSISQNSENYLCPDQA